MLLRPVLVPCGRRLRWCATAKGGCCLSTVAFAVYAGIAMDIQVIAEADAQVSEAACDVTVASCGSSVSRSNTSCL